MKLASAHLGWALAWLALAANAAAGQTVQQQIDAIFDSLPGTFTLSGRAESEDGAVVYYSRNPSTTMKPASVTKAFVVGASMSLLGPDHQFVTRVLRNGTIDGSGTLNGDLILLGNHDFTWATDYYPGNARFALDRLAEALYDQGLRSVTGSVFGYGYLMYAESPSNAAATTAFRDALNAAGISASATGTSSSFNPPGVPIAEWRSMPLSQACRYLMKASDNNYAQALMQHLAYELRGANSSSVGEDIIQAWLSAQGVDMTGNVFLDGSGLSHSNRVSALQAIGLMQTMLASPQGWDFASTLPIGGVDGTIGSRFTTGPASGRVHAKTGTLTGVITLSGYVLNPVDNQRYLFAFLMNDISGFSNTAARNAIDSAVAVMAGDVNELVDSVPGPATLLSVVGDPWGQTATLTWSAASGATAYNVYESATGSVWTFLDSTPNLSMTVSDLSYGQVRYFLVRAVNAFGEGKASDAYGVRIANTPRRVLVVDGNDRWEQGVPENPERSNHEFAIQMGASITPAVAFDTCANERVESGAVILADYDAVLWFTGEESTAHETFSATEQARVQAYLNAGGNLFVSGAEIGWDLDNLGSAGDRAFYNGFLKADYVADDAGTEQFVPSGGIFDSLPQAVGDFHPTWMVIGFPDVIAPAGGAMSNLAYVSHSGTIVASAGIEFDGAFRVVHLGFPFESIAHLPLRKALMNRILGFFLDREFPDDVIVEARDLAGTTTGSPQLQEVGAWLDSTAKSQAHDLAGTGSRFIDYSLPNTGTDHAIITPEIPVAGRYEVSVTWGLGANCFDAQYTVRHADGDDVLLVDQVPLGTPGENAHTWVSLGEYRFDAGSSLSAGSVEVSEAAVSGRPSASWNQRVYFDALKLELREVDALSAGDLDRDGDVDGDDYALWADCMAGPDSFAPPPACELGLFDHADQDGDGDVDLDDFAMFAGRFD